MKRLVWNISLFGISGLRFEIYTMLKTKSVQRALLACEAWRDLLDEFEFEYDPIDDDVYLRHLFFVSVVCEYVAGLSGNIRAETVFRQFTHMKNSSEDIFCQAISDFLKLGKSERADSAFAVLLRANLTGKDSEQDLYSELDKL